MGRLLLFFNKTHEKVSRFSLAKRNAVVRKHDAEKGNLVQITTDFRS